MRPAYLQLALKAESRARQAQSRKPISVIDFERDPVIG
jgi:hypothetical protein